jgi:hypothetical protein
VSERHAYSVVTVAVAIAEHERGTASPMQEAEREALLVWLRWRVSDGWQVVDGPDPYGDAVYALARAALSMVKP